MRTLLTLTVVALALSGCELLSPPSSTDFGKACGPDVECAGELSCVDGFCQPGGGSDDDDAGTSDAG
jgi:hypothetical protein